MRVTSAELFERALKAFVSYREEEALAYLFLVWDRLRAERLAPLIERLSARLTSRFSLPEDSPWMRARPRFETMTLPLYIERFRPRDDGRRRKPMDAAAAAHCESLELALSAREAAEARLEPTLRALFAQVYENPDDDTPRLVLADCLQELGDPRGRYIMEELQPTPRQHDADEGWSVMSVFFPLGPYGDPPRWGSFERGFLAVACPNFPKQGPLVPPGKAWGTVRELVLESSGLPDLPSLTGWLMHPNLRHLKALSRVRPRLARELCRLPLPVKRIELVSPGPDNGLWAHEPELFTHLGALPHLVQVDIDPAFPEDVALCANSPLASRLVRFEARRKEEWALVVTPSGDITVEAWLEHGDSAADLARALQGALGFGTGAVRLHVGPEIGPADRSTLREAASSYSRIEWASHGEQPR